MNGVNKPPGWHGKLPSLGDFASRRLDASFIDPWDGWLAGGLLALRENAPDTWLDDYLGSPSWRFLLMPGVLPGAAAAGAWAGVLMPSVDKVGRYFPLTLVYPLGEGPGSTQQMTGLWHWLGHLDDLARDVLHDDWSADRLEEELARMALPDISALPPGDNWASTPPGIFVEVQQAGAADAPAQIGVEAQRAWAERARGRAWWYARPDDLPARLLHSRGLPDAQSLSRLFGPAATI